MAQGARKTARLETEAERYSRDVAERIYAAFESYNSGLPRSGKLTQSDLGRLVAERMKRDKPFTQATVSSWMSETNPSLPDNLTLAAIAHVLNANATWLILGAATE